MGRDSFSRRCLRSDYRPRASRLRTRRRTGFTDDEDAAGRRSCARRGLGGSFIARSSLDIAASAHCVPMSVVAPRAIRAATRPARRRSRCRSLRCFDAKVSSRRDAPRRSRSGRRRSWARTESSPTITGRRTSSAAGCLVERSRWRALALRASLRAPRESESTFPPTRPRGHPERPSSSA